MKLGRQTVFGEFQAKNFACSGNDLQELFRKSNVKLGGGDWDHWVAAHW